MAGTDWIAVLVERNATPLSLVKDFTPGIDRTASLNVELTQTSRVRAIVRAGGKYFQVSREVKVATDDCGAQ
jgi:sulfur-oxidizing protein SoxY